MVAPNDHPLDVIDVRRGLLRKLRQSAVVVQARHGGKIASGQIGCIAAGDQGVGVGRIAYHQHSNLAVGGLIERLALSGKYLCISQQQVLAFHSRTARPGSDQKRDLAVAKGGLGLIRGHHLIQRRERAVVQLHHHSAQSRQRRRNFQQVQVHRLISAQHRTRCHAKREGVTDLASGTGDGDVYGLFH